MTSSHSLISIFCKADATGSSYSNPIGFVAWEGNFSRGLRPKPPLALTRVHNQLWCFIFFCVSVFAPYERKNPGAPWAYRYNQKYHAAAGEKAFLRGTA